MQKPWKVVDEIKALESQGPPSITKPPQLFTGKLLAGVQHKHYQRDGLRSMALNLKNELHQSGIPAFEQKIAGDC